MTPQQTLAREALAGAKSVMLVDWHEAVPRSLIAAGYEVFSCEGKYFRHEVVAAPPAAAERALPPAKPHDHGHLIYLALEEPPAEVDMVCTYRPAGEQGEIVQALVLPLRAKWFWVERGDEDRVGSDPHAIIERASDQARADCEAAGVAVIEGVSVPVVLAGLRGPERLTPQA